MGNLDPTHVFIVLFVIFFAIGLHEYAHCKVADMAGDPTPGIYGRVTLNLTKHFDPMGTIMILITSLSGYGLGWGKPAPMDPRKMANPRWDFFAAVLAGPMTNLFQAIVYALVLRVCKGQYGLPFSGEPVPFWFSLCSTGVLINISLCLFNLVPLGPLDGHWLVGLLMPEKPRYYWYKFNRQVGTIALFVLILGSQVMGGNGGPNFLGIIIGGPLFKIFTLLTGVPTR